LYKDEFNIFYSVCRYVGVYIEFRRNDFSKDVFADGVNLYDFMGCYDAGWRLWPRD